MELTAVGEWIWALSVILLLLWMTKEVVIPVVSAQLLIYRVKGLPIPGFRGNFFLHNAPQVLKAFGRAPGMSVSVYMFQGVSGFSAVFNESSMVRFILGSRPAVLLRKADVVEVLLTDSKEVNKSQEYRFIQPWLGTGLLTSSYHKWKKHRKLLTPSFHFRILDQFQPIMSDKTQILVDKLKATTDQDFVLIEEMVANCAMDIIAETSLGTNLDAQNRVHPYVQSSHDATELMFKRFLFFWLWPDWIFRVSPTGREFFKKLDVMRLFVKQTIHERRSELTKDWTQHRKSSEAENEFATKKRRAFLDMLILHNLDNPTNQLSDEEIEDEVQTFAFAGHDTTFTTLSWVIYFLGLYPEIQRKAHEESESVFGEDSRSSITMDDLRAMPYLERVIKETLRVMPAVPFIGRLLDKDFTIKGVTIPKGATAIVAVPVLHRDPEYFPNPEVFDPDRFLEPLTHPYAYVPFSAGPRNCIGQRFAMLEMKTTLSNLLRNLSWTSLDPRDVVLLSPEIVSRPSRPLRIRFKLREST